MEIKDLTKGKHKYDVSKWGKNFPEGAVRVFHTQMFEGLYSYYHFTIKNKKCGEERGYYPNGSLLFCRYFKEPGVEDYCIKFDENGNISSVEQDLLIPGTKQFQLDIIEDSYDIKRFIAKKRLEGIL